MRKALTALAVIAFVAAGAAQAETGPEQEDLKDPEEFINISQNETDGDNLNEKVERERGEPARFDARLSAAIDTVSTLVEIAPNEEAREGLREALEQLRQVQNQADTAVPEEDNDSGEQGTGDRGPSENSNRPEFVNRMLAGLFG